MIPQPLGAPVHLPLPTIGPRPNEKLHRDRRTGGDPRQGPEDVRERLARKRRANGEVIPSRELGPRRGTGTAAGPRLGHEGENDAGIGRPEERLDERPLPRGNPHLHADLSAAADKLEGDPRLSGQQSLQRRTEQTVQAHEELLRGDRRRWSRDRIELSFDSAQPASQVEREDRDGHRGNRR